MQSAYAITSHRLIVLFIACEISVLCVICRAIGVPSGVQSQLSMNCNPGGGGRGCSCTVEAYNLNKRPSRIPCQAMTTHHGLGGDWVRDAWPNYSPPIISKQIPSWAIILHWIFLEVVCIVAALCMFQHVSMCCPVFAKLQKAYNSTTILQCTVTLPDSCELCYNMICISSVVVLLVLWFWQSLYNLVPYWLQFFESAMNWSPLTQICLQILQRPVEVLVQAKW